MAMIEYEESYKGFIKDVKEKLGHKDFERMLLIVLADIAAALDGIVTDGIPRN